MKSEFLNLIKTTYIFEKKLHSLNWKFFYTLIQEKQKKCIEIFDFFGKKKWSEFQKSKK
jgi:hypothetical protein